MSDAPLPPAPLLSPTELLGLGGLAGLAGLLGQFGLLNQRRSVPAPPPAPGTLELSGVEYVGPPADAMVTQTLSYPSSRLLGWDGFNSRCYELWNYPAGTQSRSNLALKNVHLEYVAVGECGPSTTLVVGTDPYGNRNVAFQIGGSPSRVFDGVLQFNQVGGTGSNWREYQPAPTTIPEPFPDLPPIPPAPDYDPEPLPKHPPVPAPLPAPIPAPGDPGPGGGDDPLRPPSPTPGVGAPPLSPDRQGAPGLVPLPWPLPSPQAPPTGTPLPGDASAPPLPRPEVPEVPPTVERIGDLVIGQPGTSPPPTLEGIARELGKIEQKTRYLIERRQADDELPQIADLVGELLDLVDSAYPGGGYQLVGVCEPGAGGGGQPVRSATWAAGSGAFSLLSRKLDALAELLQHHKELRQPICRQKASGEEVTVVFEEI